MTDFMTQKECAKEFNICENTLRSWRQKGLPVVKIGRRNYYEKEAISKFLKFYEKQDEYV